MKPEKLGQLKAKASGVRVLSIDGGVPRMEISFEAEATIRGVAVQVFGTYWGSPRPDGWMYGEGIGSMRTEAGEWLTWRASGLGRPKPEGGVSWRATLYFQGQGKLANLAETPVLGEFEEDKMGDFAGPLSAWQ